MNNFTMTVSAIFFLRCRKSSVTGKKKEKKKQKRVSLLITDEQDVVFDVSVCQWVSAPVQLTLGNNYINSSITSLTGNTLFKSILSFYTQYINTCDTL